MRWILLLFLALPLWAQDEPEIVIELVGKPDAPVQDGLNVWNKNTKQLEKLLRGKTREEVLYQVSSVSSKDHAVTAEDGTRYRFVQYGITKGMRRLLFRAKDPQTLIACATTTREALELTLRYRVNIGLTLPELQDAYGNQLTAVELPPGTPQTLFKLTRRGKDPVFLQFKQEKLVRVLSQKQADEFIKAAQTAAEKKKPAPPPAPKQPPIQTLLIDGGTQRDQMYLPRVVNGENLPHLIPGKIPAGTPLWPQNVTP